jgi:hypothetical protein
MFTFIKETGNTEYDMNTKKAEYFTFESTDMPFYSGNEL